MANERQGGSLHNCIAAVRCEIQDILQSGNYYVTEEIAREVSVINNALEHLSLDSTFLATSNEWQKHPGNYTADQVLQHHSGALAAVHQVAVNLSKYKKHFYNETVATKQENQLREVHQWAISSLKNSQKILEPYALYAADRIKQFGDTLGVTDRYAGYRQNLTHSTRDPLRLQASWMDGAGGVGHMDQLRRTSSTMNSPYLEEHVQTNTLRLVGDPTNEFSQFGGVPASNIGALKKQIRYGNINPPMRITRGYRTIDSLYPKATAPLDGTNYVKSSVMDEIKTLNALNACDFYAKMDEFANRALPTLTKPYEKMSVQEQAGINMKFPGKTEYMIQFKAPGSDLQKSAYIINPTPDYSVYGRPMDTACYTPNFTEYQARYEWPDASKLRTVPLMN